MIYGFVVNPLTYYHSLLGYNIEKETSYIIRLYYVVYFDKQYVST